MMKKDFDILLVEDSRTQALRFQLALEKHGYHVTVAQNGLEAMSMLLRGRASIVITDWIMPEMDGSELCRAIRKHDFGNYVYIILLTAKDSKNDIIEGLEAGADDYLTKPADEAELIARLTTAERIIRLESSLKQRNREIALLSITDPLSKSFNRGYMNDNLPKALKYALRYKQPLSIILCDLDHFKKINDRYGHQTGDAVLKELVQTLNRSIRQDIDWMARYGGEEFIIVLPATDLHGATIAAERFRLMVSDMVIESEQKDKISITASFGIATLTHDTENTSISAEDLIRAADRCLYQAKEAGRNKTVGMAI
jgi:two-component system, cell cycle response regulator